MGPPMKACWGRDEPCWNDEASPVAADVMDQWRVRTRMWPTGRPMPQIDESSPQIVCIDQFNQKLKLIERGGQFTYIIFI
jgi:hypothetical protein